MNSSLKLLQEFLQKEFSVRGKKAEFLRKTGLSASQLESYLSGSAPTLDNLDRIAMGVSKAAWEVIRPESDASRRDAFLAEIAAKTTDFSDSERRYLLNAIESVKSLRPAASLQKVEKKER